MAWQVGDAPWDFDDCKIAVNNGDGSFGTPTDVYSCQMTEVTIVRRSGEGSGDGIITALASKIEKITGTVRYLGVQSDILAIITGASETSSGSTPNRIRGLPLHRERAPYFGMIARTLASEGAGDAYMFVPRCKIMGDIKISYEENNFVTIEVPFTAVVDNHLTTNSLGICVDVYEHETATDISAMPPADRNYVVVA